jgi:hypothetical protein
LAQGVGDAIAAYLVCRSSICPSDHVFHPFADIPHGSRSPDRIHNTDGQPLAYIRSRESEAEARRAKMLTKDEARRIAVNKAGLAYLALLDLGSGSLQPIQTEFTEFGSVRNDRSTTRDCIIPVAISPLLA